MGQSCLWNRQSKVENKADSISESAMVGMRRWQDRRSRNPEDCSAEQTLYPAGVLGVGKGVISQANRKVLALWSEGLLALEKELARKHGCSLRASYMVSTTTGKVFVGFTWSRM